MEKDPKGKCRRKYKVLLVLKEEKRTNDQIGIRIKTEKTLFLFSSSFPFTTLFPCSFDKEEKVLLGKIQETYSRLGLG